ncbi:uncharacterized protein G2W53_044713 [Senna tora]|uniref:Uncharacterized protein n=1 Tax=Senna tora TaxID=362788 RepID=A0A834SEC1_9FABA|nr:uncharacterized protein G2W53_044713 [Senna tora]
MAEGETSRCCDRNDAAHPRREE